MSLEHLHEVYSPEYYQRHQQDYLAGVTILRKRHAIQWAYLQPAAEDIILECGCGAGVTACELAKTARQVVAIDNEPLAIAAARDFFQQLPSPQARRIHLLQADMERMPFQDASFSKISFSEVIEHVVHPVPVLLELYRVLKPGGHLVLTTWPNKAHYLWNIKYRLGRGSKEDFNPQTRASLTRLCRQTPFQLADFRFANFYFHIPKTPITINGWEQTSGLAQWCERSLARGWIGNVFGSSLYARFVKPK